MRAWVMALALAGVGAAAVTADAQTRSDRPGQALTLKRIYGSPDLGGTPPRSLRISPDGTLLTSLRNRADDRERFDLWALDTRTGAERMLVDSRKVGSGAELSEAEKMQRERARIGGQKGIVAYQWSPDGRSILVPLDGDLYLATLDGRTRRLTDTPEGELNPGVSPRGSFVSFVRDQNLFVQPLTGGVARQVTTGGAGTVHWGEAEFVAQEEMDRRTGYWWSPDDRLIAVERFDEAPVETAVRASIGASGTKTFEQRYPAAGTPNVLVELYVMRPDGSGQVKVDLGRETDIYLARVDWTPDGSALLVQRQSRDQRTLDMLRVDPATGKSTVLFSERAGPKSWVNLSDAYHAMPNGDLLWTSERDGYRHLYRFSKGRWTQLTRGPWVITELVGVDEAKGLAYFSGTKDDVLEQHVYRLDLNRRGEPVRLTERGFTNSGSMDKAATRLTIARSGPAQPPQVYLADASGQRLRWLNENAVVQGHPYAPYLASHRPTQFGTLKAADGSTLHWEMITPPLEPGRRYPVFFEHYGGPGTGQQVTRGWQGPMPQYLVDQGWIYFKIDNRGSYNRGKAFEDQIWQSMGGVEVVDQLAGANYLKSLPFVDGGKIATYGWSYGGYMSLKMLQANPGVYAAAVAGAPVSDWRLYDTHYTERYMGDPRKVARAYDEAGAIKDATKVRDPLLLIHGMADDNVFLSNTTLVAAEMQKGGVPFEMMMYPGYTHRVGGPDAGPHLWGTILGFLDREVKNKPSR